MVSTIKIKYNNNQKNNQIIMGQLVNISVKFSAVDQSRLTTDKNGNQWLNLSGWINDEMDQYGSFGFVTQTPTKEEREAKEKLPILGNFKLPMAKGAPMDKIVQTAPNKPSNFESSILLPDTDAGDDLPF
jgi:hypothetical protein